MIAGTAADTVETREPDRPNQPARFGVLEVVVAYSERTSATEQARLAFEDWVTPYLPRMALVAARLGSPNDRDDILQEALIRAWRHRKKFDSTKGTATGWLLTITANVARSSSGSPLVARLRVSPPQPVKDLDQRFDLDDAIARLPERQRLSVHLFYGVGLSVAETAQVMGCSEGTVKSTLADARANLKSTLSPIGTR